MESDQALQAFRDFYDSGLRADSRLVLCQFAAAHAAAAGGVLVVRAASKAGGRGLADVAYRTERWNRLLNQLMAGGVASSDQND
jgi:hypothetical protein